MSFARLPLVLLLVAAACGDSSTSPTPTPPPPPPAAVATIELAPASISIVVGETSALTATLRDASGNTLTGRTVTWSSSASTIASVAQSGVITAVSAGGPVTITVTSEGRTGTAQVTVAPIPVAAVEVTPASSAITVGETASLAATVRDAGGNTLTGRTVTWSSSAGTIASVSQSGVITAVSAGGPVTITATSEGRSGTAQVTVAPIPVAAVEVAPGSSTIILGETASLNATVRDAGGNALTGRTVTWSSSAGTVASVSASGVVTAVSVGGPVTITATSEGRTGTAQVTVAPIPVAAVEVTPASGTIQVAGTTTLAATPRAANGTALTGRSTVWSSANTAVATVSQGGQVTGVSAGSTTIRATVDGIIGTAEITVNATPGIAAVSAGYYHTCALRSDGTAHCWGANFNGQLGDGTTTGRLTPTPVAGGHTFKQIAVGLEYTCGIDSNDVLRCWGRGAKGELGNGSTANMLVPTPVTSPGEKMVAVSLALQEALACARSVSGKVYCWGEDPDGRDQWLDRGAGADAAARSCTSGHANCHRVASRMWPHHRRRRILLGPERERQPRQRHHHAQSDSHRDPRQPQVRLGGETLEHELRPEGQRRDLVLGGQLQRTDRGWHHHPSHYGCAGKWRVRFHAAGIRHHQQLRSSC